MIGQDPYPQKDVATGVLFGNKEGTKLSPSLEIVKEACINFEIPHNGIIFDPTLESWAKQGVLLMNTILTVEEHKPLSHQDKGWQNFTNEALRWINEKDGPVVFLLWGSKAIQSKKLLTNPKHLILTSPHPSPLSAYRGFFGNNHFKLANEYLIKNNETPIQWI